MATKKGESSSTTTVRVALVNVGTDIALESPQSPAEIKSAVAKALAGSEPLVLTDTRGREYVIPADKIGFVEIGEQVERRVGFAQN
ncbi:MAG: hypothetical protein RL301_241 [Actinomycetota bacterium]|jgi:hypothetical protein